MDKDYTKTLKWINKWRRLYGDPELDEILTGARNLADACPIANSIGHGVVVTSEHLRVYQELYEGSWYAHPHLPRYVRRFIKRFDCGEYPELVAPVDMSKVKWMQSKEAEELVKVA